MTDSCHCEMNSESILTDSSVLRTKPWTHKKGNFTVFDSWLDTAESVYLVGSFNGWSNSHPMKKISEHLWQAELPEGKIKDGDTYKFKAVSNGNEVYLTDPFALENDGPPHFNSIYREFSGENYSADFYRRVSTDTSAPLNILSVRADSPYGDLKTFKDIARELIPYMLQMGYTHLCVTDAFDNYYDFRSESMLNAYLAPRRDCGGIDGFWELVHSMHESGLRVLLDYGMICERADMRVIADSARYWLECCGIDGLAVSAGSKDAADRISEVYEYLRGEFPNARFFDRDRGGERVIGADMRLSDYDTALSVFGSFDVTALTVQVRKALMSYILVSSGVGFTSAGCELGRPSDGINRESSCTSIPRNCENAEFQLFVSDLNWIYLSNPCLWSRAESRTVSTFGAAATVECRGENGTVFLAVDTSGGGCEVKNPILKDALVILDSHSQRYGGESRNAPYRTVAESVHLAPYGVIIAFCDELEGDK